MKRLIVGALVIMLVLASGVVAAGEEPLKKSLNPLPPEGIAKAYELIDRMMLLGYALQSGLTFEEFRAIAIPLVAEVRVFGASYDPWSFMMEMGGETLQIDYVRIAWEGKFLRRDDIDNLSSELIRLSKNWREALNYLRTLWGV